MDVRHISAADTAKLVRKALKVAFPTIKFYVRTSTYAGGASINVAWMDGPTQKEVEAIVKRFEGAGFDGMIDLKYYATHWLMPDGTTIVARCHQEEVYNPAPSPDAELVSFGADWVQCDRSCSPEFVRKVGEMFSQETGWNMPAIETGDWYVGRSKRGTYAWFKVDYLQPVPGGTEPVADWFNRELWKTSAIIPMRQDPKPQSNGKIEIRYEGSWTWIQFPSKPPAAVCKAIMDLGAQWSQRRGKWYIRQRVACAVVLDAITAAAS